MFETVPFVRSGTLPFWKAIGEITGSVVVQFQPSITGNITTPQPQDSSLEIRYSENADFTDEIAALFLKRVNDSTK